MASEPGAAAEGAKAVLKAEVAQDDDEVVGAGEGAAAALAPAASGAASARRADNQRHELQDEMLPAACRVKTENVSQPDRVQPSHISGEHSSIETAGGTESALSMDFQPGHSKQHDEQFSEQDEVPAQFIASAAASPSHTAVGGSSMMIVPDPYQTEPSERYQDNQMSHIEEQGISQRDSGLHDQQHDHFGESAIGALPVPLPSRASSEDAAATAASMTEFKRPSPEPLEDTPTAAQPFSWNDILRVQNMIERCLQQYFSKNEILLMLQEQAQVDPEFTNVVWQKLQEQNPSFFRAYNIQLQLQEQILAFNYLVMQQKEMMQTGSRVPSSLPSLHQGEGRRMPGASFGRTPTAVFAAPSPGQAHPSMPFAGMGPSSSTQFAPAPTPAPLPLPSPIKTDLDTHAFFT